MVAPKNNVKENKPRMSELPLDVLAKMLCPAYAEGTDKYYRNSWREGFKTSDMMDALLRHIDKFYYQREDYDPEYPKKHHLGAAAFCLIAMYHSWEIFPELDDRPGKINKNKINLEITKKEMTMVTETGMNFGDAFEQVKTGKAMRLPSWQRDVKIKVQFPDEHSKMTAPYLYVESRFGKVPWRETMIELFSEEWEVTSV